MTLSRYSATGRQYLSAAVLTEWSETLMQYFAWATGRVGLFNTTNTTYSEDNDGTEITIWSGYLLYTGATDTFRCTYYHIADAGAEQAVVTITLNGVVIKSTNSGTDGTTIDTTIDLTTVGGLGLVANTVYPLTLSAHRTGTSSTVNLTVGVRWLGLELIPTYTTIPTFSDVSAFSIADINAVADAIEEIGQCVAMPVSPTARETINYSLSDDTNRPVWRGYMRFEHNWLHVRVKTLTDSAGDGTWDVLVNGTDVGGGTLSTAYTEETQDIDLSTAGLTRGNYYPVEIQVRRTGTSSTINVTVEAIDIVQYSTVTVTAPTAFTADVVTTAAALNWYKGVVDIIHPAATSPTAPCYFSQPAVRISPVGRYYLKRQRQWLHWINDGAGTTEIDYSTYTQALSGSSGQQDLTQYSTLLPGTEYYIDDCNFAQEWDYA